MKRMTRHPWGVLLVTVMITMLACGSLAGGIRQVKEVAKTAKEVATTVAESNATESATSVPQAGQPTQVPNAEATTAPSAGTGQEQLNNTLANVVKLAPVHATSLWASYNGKDLKRKMRVEMDIDTVGNRHIFIFQGGKMQTEIVAFGDQLFLRNGPDEQFISLPGQAGGADLAYMSLYGAPWLMFFNDVQNAKKVGHETVNGFSADKYDTKFNTMGMGILGAAAAAQGGAFDYKGTAWIESKTKALVKATVDITVKNKGNKVPSVFQVRYDVKKAKVAPIQKPTNVFTPPVMPGS